MNSSSLTRPLFRYSPGSKWLGLMFLILLPGVWQASQAYDWNNDYGVDATVGYDDNFRLNENDELETTSTRLGVFANLEGTTEISNLRLTLGANSTTYSESEIDDSDGYRLSLDTSRRGERFSSYLNLSLDSQSTTETELLDTGAVEDGTRDSASLAPGMSYRINERNSISLGLSFRDVTYDTVSLTEYTDNAVTLGWSYQLDETSSFSVNLRTSEYDPDDDDTTDTNNLSLGYTMSPAEATNYTFSVGYSDVNRPDDSESSGNYAIDINRRTDERNSYSFTLSNDYVSSGAGEVRDEDSAGVNWVHSLSEKSQFNLGAQASSNDQRDFVSIELGGNYNYTREINLGASLRHRRQESDSVDADSSSVFFSLSYSPI